MTGFGRGRCEVAGRRVAVEIRSVNHRFLELKLRLPWSDALLEQLIGQAVRKKVARGALSLSVRDEGGTEGGAQVTADTQLARAYHRALAEVAEACGLAEAPSLALIAAQPGVLLVGQGSLDGEVLWAALAAGVEQALDDLTASRTREGEALRADLVARVKLLRGLAADVGRIAADAPNEARRRLEERLRRLLDGSPATQIDPQRLAQEVALIADRADVAEELTRLALHFDEMERLLADPEPAGRRLDFLVQELNREVNTIGSKSQRADIAARVVEAKAEMERIREQIQNLE